MARTPHNDTEKGSQIWLQEAVNENQEILNETAAQGLLLQSLNIEWFSPLRCDEYAEYSDQDFTNLLELDLTDYPLSAFWPKGGPHWDGLARTDSSQVFMVEAKSYIGEMKEKGTRAKSDTSIAKIKCSLKKTQMFLGSDLSKDWSKYPDYQYANRLAHLYHLRVLNGIDAYLLMIYFLNDSANRGPSTPDQWEDAIQQRHERMGLLNCHRLSDRILNLYPDIKEMKVRKKPLRRT